MSRRVSTDVQAPRSRLHDVLAAGMHTFVNTQVESIPAFLTNVSIDAPKRPREEFKAGDVWNPDTMPLMTLLENPVMYKAYTDRTKFDALPLHVQLLVYNSNFSRHGVERHEISLKQFVEYATGILFQRIVKEEKKEAALDIMARVAAREDGELTVEEAKQRYLRWAMRDISSMNSLQLRVVEDLGIMSAVRDELKRPDYLEKLTEAFAAYKDFFDLENDYYRNLRTDGRFKGSGASFREYHSGFNDSIFDIQLISSMFLAVLDMEFAIADMSL